MPRFAFWRPSLSEKSWCGQMQRQEFLPDSLCASCSFCGPFLPAWICFLLLSVSSLCGLSAGMCPLPFLSRTDEEWSCVCRHSAPNTGLWEVLFNAFWVPFLKFQPS